jgi:hypothetical protein
MRNKENVGWKGGRATSPSRWANPGTVSPKKGQNP